MIIVLHSITTSPLKGVILTVTCMKRGWIWSIRKVRYLESDLPVADGSWLILESDVPELQPVSWCVVLFSALGCEALDFSPSEVNKREGAFWWLVESRASQMWSGLRCVALRSSVMIKCLLIWILFWFLTLESLHITKDFYTDAVFSQ